MSRLAIIGGSQAYSLLEAGQIAGIRVAPINTPFGESQAIYRLDIDGADVLLMSRHGETGYSIAPSWVNYRANIWALKELGTERIVSWSGPGAIDTALRIGQLVLPDDLIDETRSRAHSFFEGSGLGFIRQHPVFCRVLRGALHDVLGHTDAVPKTDGTYVCTEGPRLETQAEIRKYKLLGADMVGMTLAPEVFLARELEMCYAPICYITNYAEGIRERRHVSGVLFEGLLDEEEKASVDAAVRRFPDIITRLAVILRDSIDFSCGCSRLMERYRIRGDIESDWHTWIGR
jgi:5'-methylthioadenosine phosphorylase